MTTATTDTAGRAPALLGQTVVVIGGSSGIGLETARQARAEGAEVVLAGLSRGPVEQAAAELGAKQMAAFDATDSQALKGFFAGLPVPVDHVMVTGPTTARVPVLLSVDVGMPRTCRGTARPFTRASGRNRWPGRGWCAS